MIGLVQAYSTAPSRHFLLLTPCTLALTGWAHCWVFTEVNLKLLNKRVHDWLLSNCRRQKYQRKCQTDPISPFILLLFFLLFLLLLGRRSTKKHDALSFQIASGWNLAGLVNTHRLTESDFRCDIIITAAMTSFHAEVLSRVECTRSVCPAAMQQRPPVADLFYLLFQFCFIFISDVQTLWDCVCCLTCFCALHSRFALCLSMFVLLHYLQ